MCCLMDRCWMRRGISSVRGETPCRTTPKATIGGRTLEDTGGPVARGCTPGARVCPWPAVVPVARIGVHGANRPSRVFNRHQTIDYQFNCDIMSRAICRHTVFGNLRHHTAVHHTAVPLPIYRRGISDVSTYRKIHHIHPIFSRTKGFTVDVYPFPPRRAVTILFKWDYIT